MWNRKKIAYILIGHWIWLRTKGELVYGEIFAAGFCGANRAKR